MTKNSPVVKKAKYMVGLPYIHYHYILVEADNSKTALTYAKSWKGMPHGEQLYAEAKDTPPKVERLVPLGELTEKQREDSKYN